jgi:hypothetical protein
MTPTGTNLLGLMKHLASEEYGYLGEVFGRPAPEQLACVADGSIWQNGDMWATPEESTEYIMAFHRRACAHADIVRELIDGVAGGGRAGAGFPDGANEQWWRDYVAQLESAARTTAGR